MQLSVVIPALNEAGNIGRLVQETLASVPADMLGEIIVVNDASTDATVAEVLEIAVDDDRVRCLSHDERSGQSAALRTGIQHARFSLIGTMDGDGQNDPADFAKLLDLIDDPDSTSNAKQPVALVGGIRTQRKDTGSKRWASRAANKIRDAVLRDNCPDTGCGIKVFWREPFLRLPFFTSVHRYLPALYQTYGYSCAYQDVNHRERGAGVSKYNNLNRALVGLYDLVGVSWIRRRSAVPHVTEQTKVKPEKDAA